MLFDYSCVAPMQLFLETNPFWRLPNENFKILFLHWLKIFRVNMNLKSPRSSPNTSNINAFFFHLTLINNKQKNEQFRHVDLYISRKKTSGRIHAPTVSHNLPKMRCCNFQCQYCSSVHINSAITSPHVAFFTYLLLLRRWQKRCYLFLISMAEEECGLPHILLLCLFAPASKCSTINPRSYWQRLCLKHFAFQTM